MRSICLFSRLLNSAQGLLFCAQSVALSTSLRRNTGLRSGGIAKGIALVLDLVIVLAVQGLFLCLKVLGCQQPPGRLEPSRSAFAAQRPLTHRLYRNEVDRHCLWPLIGSICVSRLSIWQISPTAPHIGATFTGQPLVTQDMI